MWKKRKYVIALSAIRWQLHKEVKLEFCLVALSILNQTSRHLRLRASVCFTVPNYRKFGDNPGVNIRELSKDKFI